MSLRQILRRLVMGRPDIEEFQGLNRIGIDVMSNFLLLARIEHMSKRLEELKELKERSPLDYIETIDHIIRTSALAWYRAAENPPLADAVMAWSTLVGMAKSFWEKLIQEESEENIRVLAKMFNSFIVKNFYPAADLMLALSFRKEDVSPQYVNVVRSQVSQPTSVIVPTEMEKRSE